MGCIGGAKKQQSVATATTTAPATNRVAAKNYGFRVVAELSHSTKAYTQGLQYVDGILWEGTGGYGSSRLTKTDMATGRVLASTDLARTYFGEGITVLGDKV
ncbi:MAG: glutaminyl-peptide cyclotransferase, partial [Tidjanibacter sp.]|nr:glutaminyl-peptide cyclotransferase [Tidjanibacter sp.]